MPRIFTEPITTPAARSRRRAPRRPLVTLTTDFGLRDPSAAICRGVILGIAPDARILDVSHEVAKYALLDGALLLWCALPYLPVGVHLAVVDPGVGTARLPIGIQVARGDVLVGPDNGLLRPAAARLGGIRAAHLLEAAPYRLADASSSFHGRDIFAPAAAHLALGVPLAELGPPLDPAALVPLELPAARVSAGRLDTEAIYVDTFGNVKLAGEPADLEAALGPLAPGIGLVLLRPDGGLLAAAPWQATFGSVAIGRPLVYEDSYGRLCLAVNQGHAAIMLGIGAGLRLAIARAGPT